MKTRQTTILCMVLTISVTTVFGQSFNTLLKQTQLKGHYTVTCFLERNQKGELTTSNLCPLVMKNSKLSFAHLEINIKDATLTIETEGAPPTTVKYTWDGEADLLSFRYKENNYVFKVLRGGSAAQLVWKEPNVPGVLLLTKK